MLGRKAQPQPSVALLKRSADLWACRLHSCPKGRGVHRFGSPSPQHPAGSHLSKNLSILKPPRLPRRYIQRFQFKHSLLKRLQFSTPGEVLVLVLGKFTTSDPNDCCFCMLLFFVLMSSNSSQGCPFSVKFAAQTTRLLFLLLLDSNILHCRAM